MLFVTLSNKVFFLLPQNHKTKLSYNIVYTLFLFQHGNRVSVSHALLGYDYGRRYGGSNSFSHVFRRLLR